MLRLFLQEANQPHRIDVVLLGKFNHATFFIPFELPNTELLCLLTQACDIQQISRRVWQQAEAVDQLNLNLFQFVLTLRTGDAFIEGQTGIYIRNEIIRQQARARADAEFWERNKNAKIKQLEDTIIEQDNTIAENQKLLAEKDAELLRLQKELAKLKQL